MSEATAPALRLKRKLEEHSRLGAEDHDALAKLSYETRALGSGADIVLQGSRPKASVVVLEGMLARYHTLHDGRRQYLSFHLAGDMPDAQCLFLDEMDHSLAAIGAAVVALVPHRELIALCSDFPQVGFAIWRETLIDAAIFRKAITLNANQTAQARLAHVFCEIYYRSRINGTAESGRCAFPMTQVQLGETLAMSLVSVSRAFSSLRRTRSFELKSGVLTILNWTVLKTIAEFDPSYLHVRRERVQADLI